MSIINPVPVNADNIYYDLVVTNLKSDKTEPIQIQFNENRAKSILSNTGEYDLSIVRFSVDTQTLPVWIPEIQSNQGDKDLTIYSVTLSYLPVGFTTPFVQQTFIRWTPQNANAKLPPPPNETASGFQSNNGFYYYAFSFQWVIKLIFQAYQTCFADLLAQVQTAGYSDLNDVLPPIISWDTPTSTASIVAESSYFNNMSVTNNTLVENPQAIQLYYNSPLFALFSSFPAINYGISATLGQNYRMAIGDFTGVNSMLVPPYTVDDSPQYICSVVNQEYSTISNWTPVSSIVFTSNTLPIISNQLSSPLIYNEGGIQSLNGNNSNFAQIITDLETNENCYKPNLIYSPTAQYRIVSMTGNSPLSNIDVSVFWKSRLGVLYPLLLMSGSSTTLKFLFTKKKLV
jgi:hypothetical protein